MKTAALLLFAIVAGCAPAAPRGPATVPPDAPLEDAGAYPDDDPRAVASGDVCARAGRVLWAATCREAGRTVVDVGNGVLGTEAFPSFCRRKRQYVDADCIVAVGPNRAELRARCAVRCIVRESDAGAP